MKKLISIDLKAGFGFFRKPDTNDGINLSYNMLHKPALLGILGAIIGLDGYKEFGKTPVYYEKLQDLQVGIEPLNHEKGNFSKTVIKYSNTVGYANKGSNYLTEEATLIAPAYRCYLLLNIENEYHLNLYQYLKEGKAEYLPYFGKNEFFAWWDIDNNGFNEYDFEENPLRKESFNIKTIFLKNEETIQNQKKEPLFDLFNLDTQEETFMYFERLPIGFDRNLNQYEMKNFAFTNFSILPNVDIDNLFLLKLEQYYVQLI